MTWVSLKGVAPPRSLRERTRCISSTRRAPLPACVERTSKLMLSRSERGIIECWYVVYEKLRSTQLLSSIRRVRFINVLLFTAYFYTK